MSYVRFLEYLSKNSDTDVSQLHLGSNVSYDFFNHIVKAIGDLKIGAGQDFVAALSQTKKVKSLELNDVGSIGILTISPALIANDTLTNLSLCQLDAEAMKAFGPALKKNNSIKMLSLRGCDEKGMEYLSDAIASHKKMESLTILRLFPKSISILANGLRTNDTLSQLNVNFSSISADDMRAFEEMLKMNKSLKLINFDNNIIDEKTFKHLADGIADNQVLQKISLAKLNYAPNEMKRWLTLGKYKLNLESMKSLAAALQKNTSLKSIDLESNSLDDKSIKYLADSIAVNTSLTEINLENNPIDEKGHEYLGIALTKNSTLKKIELSGTGLTDKALKQLTNYVIQNKLSLPLSIFSNSNEVEFFREPKDNDRDNTNSISINAYYLYKAIEANSLKNITTFENAQRLLQNYLLCKWKIHDKVLIEELDTPDQVVTFLDKRITQYWNKYSDKFKILSEFRKLFSNLARLSSNVESNSKTKPFYTQWTTNGYFINEENIGMHVCVPRISVDQDKIVAYTYLGNYPYFTVMDVWSPETDPDAKHIISIASPFKGRDSSNSPVLGLPESKDIFMENEYKFNPIKKIWERLSELKKDEEHKISLETGETFLPHHNPQIRRDFENLKRINEDYVLSSQKDNGATHFIIYYCPRNQKIENAKYALVGRGRNRSHDNQGRLIIVPLPSNRLITNFGTSDNHYGFYIWTLEKNVIKNQREIILPEETFHIVPINEDHIIIGIDASEDRMSKFKLAKYGLKEEKIIAEQEFDRSFYEILESSDNNILILTNSKDRHVLFDVEKFSYTEFSTPKIPVGILGNNNMIIHDNKGHVSCLNIDGWKNYYINFFIDLCSMPRDVANMIMKYCELVVPEKPQRRVCSSQFFTAKQLKRDLVEDKKRCNSDLNSEPAFFI